MPVTATKLEIVHAGAPLHWAVRVPGARFVSLSVTTSESTTVFAEVDDIDVAAQTMTVASGLAVLSAPDRLAGVYDLDPTTYPAGTSIDVLLIWKQSTDPMAPVPGAFFAADMPAACIAAAL